MKIVEKVFLGYQFKSKYYNKSTIESLLVDAVTDASREINQMGLNYVTLEPQLIDLKPAEGVTEGIIQLIDASSFCIFEISDNNANVMFELGNAYAKNKGLIFLKNKNSSLTKQVPSDIIGKFISYYGGDDNPCLENMRPKITKCIKEYIIEMYNKKSETWMRKLWEIKGNNLIVVSGNLNDRYEVGPKDADALFDSTIGLTNLYPGTKVKRLYSIDFSENDYQNNDLLVIGGPDSNRIAEEILDEIDSSFPFSYDEIEEPDFFELRDKNSGQIYRRKYDGETLTADFGFFLKVPNPYNTNKNVIIITGIGAEGTFGCSKALPFEGIFLYQYYVDNFSKIADKKYYCFITEAVVQNSKIDGRIIEGTTFFLDLPNNKWIKL